MERIRSTVNWVQEKWRYHGVGNSWVFVLTKVLLQDLCGAPSSDSCCLARLSTNCLDRRQKMTKIQQGKTSFRIYQSVIVSWKVKHSSEQSFCLFILDQCVQAAHVYQCAIFPFFVPWKIPSLLEFCCGTDLVGGFRWILLLKFL